MDSASLVLQFIRDSPEEIISFLILHKIAQVFFYVSFLCSQIRTQHHYFLVLLFIANFFLNSLFWVTTSLISPEFLFSAVSILFSRFSFNVIFPFFFLQRLLPKLQYEYFERYLLPMTHLLIFTTWLLNLYLDSGSNGN